MTQPPRVLLRLRLALISATLAVLAATPLFAAPQGPAGAAPGANAHAAGLQDFQQRLMNYLELRQTLAGRLKPLSPTPDAAELTARQESLAAAMQTARKNAKPGDLIPPGAAAFISQTVAADHKRRQSEAKRAVLEEVPRAPRPVVNKSYPVQAALPTVPPLLLEALPKLPDNLQYRFFGRHLVILDGDLQIIADYVLNVLPPK